MPNTNNSAGSRTLEYGLTAKELVIAPGDEAAFAELLAGFEQDLQPQGVLEQIIFDQIVHAAWNLRLFRILETELVEDGEDPLLNIDKGERVERIARCAARAERALYRSIRELRALRTGRTLRQAAAGRGVIPLTRSSDHPIN